MKSLHTLALLLAVSLLSGCGTVYSVVQSGKLLAPESFGFELAAPELYIETGADEETKDRLLKAMVQAKNAIHTAYGDVQARPVVHACMTEKCYATFGGQGSVAKVYGKRILLSPRGLTWHFIAHEWSHAEMSHRLNFFAWKRMPQWFDEGVAVAISEAPEHSESHWQYLVSANIPRPTPEELQSFQSLNQWIQAVHSYGESKNEERKAQGIQPIRPVYAAAGHEVRPWLADTGSTGLQAFIWHLNDGEDFTSAYRRARTSR